jgi:hypothetical protein
MLKYRSIKPTQTRCKYNVLYFIKMKRLNITWFKLSVFAYSGVQHILCLGLFVLYLVYPMLPVSLDCQFLIAHLFYIRFCRSIP